MTNKPQHNLDDMVREGLRKEILTGKLANGAHLSEIKISKDYDVSRTPVREALCALMADGLVEMIPNRGAFVRTPSKEDLKDVSDMYGSLMAMATRMATDTMKEKDLSKLEVSLEKLKESNDSDSFNKVRGELDAMIRTSASNSAFTATFTMVERRTPESILKSTLAEETRREIEQGYAFIITAMRRKKSDVAEKKMREVMELALDWDSATREAAQA